MNISTGISIAQNVRFGAVKIHTHSFTIHIESYTTVKRILVVFCFGYNFIPVLFSLIFFTGFFICALWIDISTNQSQVCDSGNSLRVKSYHQAEYLNWTHEFSSHSNQSIIISGWFGHSFSWTFSLSIFAIHSLVINQVYLMIFVLSIRNYRVCDFEGRKEKKTKNHKKATKFTNCHQNWRLLWNVSEINTFFFCFISHLC